MKKEFQAVADETRKWGMGLSRGGIHRRLLSEDVAPGGAPEGKARLKKSIPQERNHDAGHLGMELERSLYCWGVRSCETGHPRGEQWMLLGALEDVFLGWEMTGQIFGCCMG